MARLPILSGTMAAWAGAMFSDLAILLLGHVALVALRIIFGRVPGLHHVTPLRLAMRSHRAVILLLMISLLMQRLSPTLCNAADLAVLAFAAITLYLAACTGRPSIRRHWAMHADVPVG